MQFFIAIDTDFEENDYIFSVSVNVGYLMKFSLENEQPGGVKGQRGKA